MGDRHKLIRPDLLLVRCPRALLSGKQRGLTLVELMVALVLGMLIAMAAVAALIVARQGFSSVDNGTQLRENARFAASVLERIAIQANYNDDLSTVNSEPGLRGYDNAVVGALAGLPGNLASGSRASACGSITDTSCVNQSDVLVVRFFGASRNGAADGSMVNCAGIAEPRVPTIAPPTPEEQRAYSIFHVVRSSAGEPTLACTYRNPADSTFVTVPLVRGVEAFQVLYGVDGVTDGAASGAYVLPPKGVTPTNDNDQVPEAYFTATQLDVAGVYNRNNWNRVHSLRIGLLIRGEPGSALTTATRTWNVLGDSITGFGLSTPADGRLRQSLVFTVQLRNPQFNPNPTPP